MDFVCPGWLFPVLSGCFRDLNLIPWHPGNVVRESLSRFLSIWTINWVHWNSLIFQVELGLSLTISLSSVENVTNSTWSCKVVWFLAGQSCSFKNHATFHDHCSLITISTVHYKNGNLIKFFLHSSRFLISLLNKGWADCHRNTGSREKASPTKLNTVKLNYI